jgi:hypothetical protein
LSNLANLALAAGAVVAYNAFNKASAAGSLNFYPSGARSLRFDGITPVITIGIAIQNPSNQYYSINSFVGNVSANGYLIGNVSSFGKMVVRPNAQTVYPITVRLSLLGVVNDIVNAIQGSGIQQQLDLSATANVNNFLVPVKLKYQLP